MGFGKRPSTSAQVATSVSETDVHARRRVLPDEAWQGEAGAMLRQLGLHQDDESNLVPNAAFINARIDHSRAAHNAAFEEAQSRVQVALDGARIRPFFLIPDPVWNSPAGHFLMASLELFPYDKWNVIYLAADERTALALDLALHPNGDIPTFVEASKRFVTDTYAQLRRVHADAGRTHDFTTYAAARDDARTRVVALAGALSQSLLEAWAKSGSRRGGRA